MPSQKSSKPPQAPSTGKYPAYKEVSVRDALSPMETTKKEAFLHTTLGSPAQRKMEEHNTAAFGPLPSHQNPVARSKPDEDLGQSLNKCLSTFGYLEKNMLN